MKVLLISSLSAAIAATLFLQTGNAIVRPIETIEFEQSERIDTTHAYRRYQGGTGRREILS